MEGEMKGAVLGAEEGVRGVGEGVEAGEREKDTKEKNTKENLLFFYTVVRKSHSKKISVFAFVNFFSLFLVADM